MSKPEKVVRKYKKSDSKLLEQAQAMKTNFVEDLAAFTARFAHMDADFATDWQTAIDAADDAPLDDVVVGDQKETTQDFTAVIETAKKKYGHLQNFLRVVYKANPKRVLEHFGMISQRKKRLRQNDHKELLAIAYQRANSAKYKNTLLTAGFTQPEIDELNTLAQQLETGSETQEQAKTDRPEMRQQRIMLYNAVWAIMCEVHDASLTVFENDYAKQQKYLLYPERNNSGNTVIETRQGPIGAGVTLNIGGIPSGTTKMLMQVVGLGNQEFGRSNDGLNFSGNTISLGDNGQTMAFITDFASTGPLFLVRNHNGGAAGEYKVEFIA